jgi:hypothetical protein
VADAEEEGVVGFRVSKVVTVEGRSGVGCTLVVVDEMRAAPGENT